MREQGAGSRGKSAEGVAQLRLREQGAGSRGKSAEGVAQLREKEQLSTVNNQLPTTNY
ncbi:hypothetical protein [Chroococcidiopsis sp. CCNUC1]|uniref:hypothetical protein n=1 Tax=Chroococcidiopsis sp. CCNUC1 TaxID=2653189 RepID=UPI00202078D8|nr:hypothetical protein [Chroococcidiopsis sp. CCNUC1]URD51469.1 hypothetical protein M5J74_05660 [Chroococcidiopsis sp. CCNUC1]